MSERWTYDDLKIGTFRLMYMARQNIIRDNRPWLHPIEDVGVAFQDPYYEGMDDLGRLMFETRYLILCAGLSPEMGFNRATEVIKSILDKTTIDELVKDIPAEEARELRYDLEILGFIPPDITKPQYG